MLLIKPSQTPCLNSLLSEHLTSRYKEVTTNRIGADEDIKKTTSTGGFCVGVVGTSPPLTPPLSNKQQQHSSTSASSSSFEPPLQATTTTATQQQPHPPSHLRPKYLPCVATVASILDQLQHEADLLGKKISECETLKKHTLNKTVQVKAAVSSLSKKGSPSSVVFVGRGGKRVAAAPQNSPHQPPLHGRQKGGAAPARFSSSSSAQKRSGGKASGGVSSSASLLELALRNAARKTSSTATPPQPQPRTIRSIFDIRKSYYIHLYNTQPEQPPAKVEHQPPATTTTTVDNIAADTYVGDKEGGVSSEKEVSTAPAIVVSSKESTSSPSTITAATTATASSPSLFSKLRPLKTIDRELEALRSHPIAQLIVRKNDLEHIRCIFESTFNRFYAATPRPSALLCRLLDGCDADLECACMWQVVDRYSPSHFLGVDALLLFLSVLSEEGCAISSLSSVPSWSTPNETPSPNRTDAMEKQPCPSTTDANNTNRSILAALGPMGFPDVACFTLPFIVQYFSETDGKFNFDSASRTRLVQNVSSAGKRGSGASAVRISPHTTTTRGMSVRESMKYLLHSDVRLQEIDNAITTTTATASLASSSATTSSSASSVVAVVSSPSVIQPLRVALHLEALITSLEDLIKVVYVTQQQQPLSSSSSLMIEEEKDRGIVSQSSQGQTLSSVVERTTLKCESEAIKFESVMVPQRPLLEASDLTSLCQFTQFLTGTRSVQTKIFTPTVRVDFKAPPPLPGKSLSTPTRNTPSGARKSAATLPKSIPARKLPARRQPPAKKKKHVWDDDESEEESSSEEEDQNTTSEEDDSSSGYEEDDDSPPRRKPQPKKKPSPKKSPSTTTTTRVVQLTSNHEDAPLISHVLSSKVGKKIGGGAVSKKKPSASSSSSSSKKKPPPKKQPPKKGASRGGKKKKMTTAASKNK